MFFAHPSFCLALLRRNVFVIPDPQQICDFSERKIHPMSNDTEHFPAATRAADAIDQKRMNETPAHHCSGSDCVTCSWRPSDLEEVSAIIERELSLGAIVHLLQKLQALRAESDP